MSLRKLLSVILSILAVALHGCSASNLVDAPSTTDLLQISSDSEGEALNPLRLELEDENSDGERLYVKGKVRARTAVQQRQVVIHLTTLRNGEKIGEAYYPLAALQEKKGPEGMLAAQEEVPFSISASAIDMTDYQIELLWGEDALHFLSAHGDAEVGKSDNIMKITDAALLPPDCGNTSCIGKSYITALLRNEGKRIIKTAVLSLSLKGAQENVLELKDIDLKPNATRPLRLEIDLPYSETLKLEPNLKIVKEELGELQLPIE